ncbi:MAG: radical SAM protein [Spirochaetes bacterium]|nr:radical SAM protein [Deltaproteobacteria bacterium]RKY00494.1 MAG: radical SAM protein [Spirochaetota bacterium]
MREASYISLCRTGEIYERIKKAKELMNPCRICPRLCGAKRLEGEKGFCKTGAKAFVSSALPHFGEEEPLVGKMGSGTIFITHCNLRCLFCQNFEISHLGEGKEISNEEFANIMINLQNRGCHNINFVTPTHVVPQILEALPLAVEKGLKVPLVYNTGGYDMRETISLLDGVFDIYMPDIKFSDNLVASKYLNVDDYWERVKEAVKEMHRQVGDLALDEDGIAYKGLLIRHLVMPEDLAGTKEVMRFLAKEISKNSYVNIMDQYRPCGYAHRYPEISRGITRSEYLKAIESAREEGITRLDKRTGIRILRFF